MFSLVKVDLKICYFRPQILEMETIPEKKRCSGCAKMRLVETFEEGRKNCVKCAEKRRRPKQNNYEYIIELERQIV